MKPPIVEINNFNWEEMMKFKEQRRFKTYKDKGHYFFDKIWRDVKLLTRSEAYKWLADKLELEEEKAHFTFLNNEQCSEAIWYSQQLLNDVRRMNLDFGDEPVTPFYIL